MMSSQNFPPSFFLLQQEGYLIRSCLSIGLTELRAAHVHNKGAFYSALFNLSVGFERLLKAIVIIDHMLHNDLAVPTKKQLQGHGHNITDLYDSCEEIAVKRQVFLPSRSQLDAINQDLLLLISSFARTTRYHNLDALSASQNGIDPLAHWGHIILAILDKDVSQRQKNKILTSASWASVAIDNISLTLMHDLDQSPLSTFDAFALPGLHEQAVRYAVLRFIKILSPIRDLLSCTSNKAYGLNQSPPFPQMQEFLQWIWDDRQYVLRKKKWP